jgi:hypothetical protein
MAKWCVSGLYEGCGGPISQAWGPEASSTAPQPSCLRPALTTPGCRLDTVTRLPLGTGTVPYVGSRALAASSGLYEGCGGPISQAWGPEASSTAPQPSCLRPSLTTPGCRLDTVTRLPLGTGTVPYVGSWALAASSGLYEGCGGPISQAWGPEASSTAPQPSCLRPALTTPGCRLDTSPWVPVRYRTLDPGLWQPHPACTRDAVDPYRRPGGLKHPPQPRNRVV